MVKTPDRPSALPQQCPRCPRRDGSPRARGVNLQGRVSPKKHANLAESPLWRHTPAEEYASGLPTE